MVDFSVVNFGYVNAENRLDAEYYKQSFLDVFKKLQRCPSKRLESIAENVIGGPFGSTVVVSQYVVKGIPFLRISNISDVFINSSDMVYVDSRKRASLKRFILGSGDIVSSRVGTIGLFSVLTDDYPEWIIGSNLIAVKKPFGVKTYFLLAFLNSKFGKMQILRPISGQVQEKITAENVKKLLVPILPDNFQIQIENVVREAYRKKRLAEQMYQEAEALLYDVLDSKKEQVEELEKEKTYPIKFAEVAKSLRFDSEYYHPKYIGIKLLLKKGPFQVRLLKEVATVSTTTIDPQKGDNRTRKFKYAPIAKIAETGEIFEWDEFYGWAAPSRARKVIRKGDVLVPSLGGTFGKIGLVPEELNKELTTTGCFVVRAKDNIPEFLFLFFKSLFFKRQLEQRTTGGIMSSVPKPAFDNLLVPDVSEGDRQRIAAHVKGYFALRKEYRNLVASAIKETEKAIEGLAENGFVRQ